MRIRPVCLGTAAVVSLGLLAAGTAQAAPLGGSSGRAATTADKPSMVEKADYRRCWISPNGVRHCRWVAEPYDGYGYYDDGYYYDEPVYGYGPSVGFFFGGGGHRHGFHGGGGHFGGGHGGGHVGHR